MLTAAGRFRQHWSMLPELFTEGPDPDSILVVEDDIALRAEEEEKVALLDAGADDFIIKPCGTAELLARVRGQLRRSATSMARG